MVVTSVVPRAALQSCNLRLPLCALNVPLIKNPSADSRKILRLLARAALGLQRRNRDGRQRTTTQTKKEEKRDADHGLFKSSLKNIHLRHGQDT